MSDSSCASHEIRWLRFAGVVSDVASERSWCAVSDGWNVCCEGTW